jgi:hypothetical protein
MGMALRSGQGGGGESVQQFVGEYPQGGLSVKPLELAPVGPDDEVSASPKVVGEDQIGLAASQIFEGR